MAQPEATMPGDPARELRHAIAEGWMLRNRVREITSELEAQQEQARLELAEARRSLMRLNSIALWPNPASLR